MAGEMKENKRYQKTLTDSNILVIIKGLINGIGQGIYFFWDKGLVFLIIWCIISTAFIYGGYLISIKSMTVGDLIRVFGFMIFSVMGLGLAVGSLPVLLKR
jgi:ATP-binding cassette subfamily B (MDR/TAP) protein 1